MSTIPLSKLPASLLLWAILLSVSLSGCQIIPLQTQPEPVAKVDNEVAPEAVEKHGFALTEGQTLIGTLAVMKSRENDTLPDIARHFGLGYNDITHANPFIEPWTPAPASQVLLPIQFILPNTPHQGITLNLANMRLFYYPKTEPNKVYTYPIGIGRQGWNTPTGVTQIAGKKANPVWNVPPSIHQEHAQKGDPLPGSIGPGPDNPLGLYAMNLGFERYLIHGTNKPYGIGMQISHGCVQLYPEDIEVLFNKVAIGVPVRIVHQPYLTAWQEGSLYLEANKPLSKWAGDKARLKKQLLKDLKKISAKQNVSVDWEKVERIIERADGIPTPILSQSPNEIHLAATAMPLKHPEHLYQQPAPETIKASDWAALVSRFDNGAEAQKLTVMLTHQGPMIPAHKIQKDNGYLVIAGPFKSKKELKNAAKRIRMNFDIDVEPLKPTTVSVD
ncbi:MAG: L,D-transpeptidase family protein [Methylovulum sp.]|uniref:L,D-transpeptidase family protein n=1 Tax=Methylovulum sp. TaxID=1916980 RepID=UPI002636172D|nr:L,D-transpeptidase family protein [Methylovulum sp.]MDD2725371.1 L,D-transpeptidase family protein [Methylovulum sp.]MDD5126199.1 L,D-transpeptidase family protein [Methylovulum sp.]